MLSRASTSLLRSSKSNAHAHALAAMGGAIRNLNVHEHISMELFNAHGIATPNGAVAFTPQEAADAYASMGNRKFDFHVGGSWDCSTVV